MTSRISIERGNLIYTQDLGWIDQGHAKGDDARLLWRQFTEEKEYALLKGYFSVNYVQSMSKYRVASGVQTQWFVKRGLPLNMKQSLAMTIMYHTSLRFETLQSNLFLNSGFSCEDLISNLLGFYKTLIPRDYMTLIKPKGKDYSYKIWDYYGDVGKYKNSELKPLIFPDPERFPNNARPYSKPLPFYMSSIKPYPLNMALKDKVLIRNIDRFMGGLYIK
ncbi:hypothetical protein [Enterobacillus tribolii]|uniref:Uncharacterized protein n=1 Tax=Enterobacillus tribolii TaxID=1487935 RepID=A0A370QLX9_9GAMM|nr:hypothetical protein [Enterobacillus tribolii]MBW7982204.1 hypothetical protein [Enterobacillus tribolii]RDK89373.1 hypothetical protein C8D90_10724 [Enterobacillus tribolii]